MSLAHVAMSRFEGRGGSETFLAIEAPAGLDFAAQVRAVEQAYDDARGKYGLVAGSAVFRRVFLSDVLNQNAHLRDSVLTHSPADDPVAVSVVQQPPLSGAKIAMLAYHVEGGDVRKRRMGDSHVVVEKNGLRHLWSTGLCAGNADGQADAAGQTRAVFERLTEGLGALGGSLCDECVRTWIYLKDIDLFYRSMVDSRIEVFDRYGLTAETHYLASTGIEGACEHQFDVMTMDAYSVLGLAPEQMSFLNDFECMCPTRAYGVTFERGTRIAYADRSHHFISGTASIDSAGRVVHRGDPLAQLDRALFNVDAILRSGQGSLADLQYLLVYLRDPSDYGSVSRYLAGRFPSLPVLIVQGAVCRPDWLIEVEGQAIAPLADASLPRF